MTRAMTALLAAAALGAHANAAAALASGGDPVYDALASLAPSFISSGTHSAADAYTFVPVECLYLEPENVTCAQCSWGSGGACPLLSLATSSPPPDACNVSAPDTGFDMPGGDALATPITGGWQACAAQCCASPVCAAGYVWVPSAPADFLDCKSGSECCYMKGQVEHPVKSSIPGIVSATVSKPASPMIPPPLGLRSAVPLGGVGAGAIELRGDGSFHEVTIQNQSPGGAAKYGVWADALLAVRVGGAPPSSLRTHPPPGVPGVAALTYSGAYPVSRLTIDDPSVAPAGSDPVVHAFSHLVPGDKVVSGKPAIVFSLSLTNPSTTESLPVSFALSVPLAGINDCARNSRAAPVANTQAPSAAACLHACAAAPQCASWTWHGEGASAGACTLNADISWSVHEGGAACGVGGQWLPAPQALTFWAYPAGRDGNASDSNPAAGDVTLAAVVDQASTVFTGLTVTAGVGDNVTAAWASVFGSAPSTAAAPASGTHGMLSVSGSLPPGASGTLSLVLAWYFPDRDHMGVDVGNFYSTLYRDSRDVASALTGSGALAAAVGDVAALHSMLTSSSLPMWLVDHSINSLSHMRTVIWTRDGRWRQWEAPDCPDVDSIHNDYQRHLPYLWLFPDNEIQKLDKWASGQVVDTGSPDFGLIYEYLGSFGLGPLDVPGGRVMADTTSLWVVEALELWRNTGDDSLLERFYPTAARAVAWQVNRARRAGVGIPDHLVNTYDITGPQAYNATTFNAALYLTSMQAGAALADAMGDAATAALARTAYAQGVNATLALLWNASDGSFTAFTGVPGSVHADCLYGQMLALYLAGPGDESAWHFSKASVASHLAVETARNGNPFGFTVVTGRSPTPTPGTQLGPRSAAALAAGTKAHVLDSTNWMGAAPTWSALQVALGVLSLDDALDPTQRSLDNFRTRLNDFWSFTGLVSGVWGDDGQNGQPHTTSHYGFHMPFFYLIPALAGQFTDLPGGALTFSPPGLTAGQAFTLPFFLAGAGGTVARSSEGAFSLTLQYGALSLPAGGLAVAGVAYPPAVSLAAGGSVTWAS